MIDMPHLRFVHAADLHLDSPFIGIKAVAPENVASTLQDATFSAYENIVNLCIEERVDALLVAGDVYDAADRSLRAQLKFVDGLKRLDEAGIRSFVCHGNHDPLNGWEAQLEYPKGCTRFGEEAQAVPVLEDDPERAVVYGISYPMSEVSDNLALRLGPADSSTFSIGLVHANVDSDTKHLNYAPCSLDDLERSGIDYWALGHVHTRQVLRERTPTVVYPGNPQGRHPNEPGPRGVYLVEVDDGGDVRLDFRSVDNVRWERTRLDISIMENEQDLIDALHNSMDDALNGAVVRSIVLRIALSGRGVIHGSLRQSNFIEGLIEDVNREWARRSPFAWCERIEDDTATPFNRDERINGSDFLAEVLRTADRAKANSDLLARLQIGLSDLYQHRLYRQHLSDHVPSGDDLSRMIDEAEAILVNLLGEDEEP
ncbi:MAG: DNA repair exonuclease [Candidatus Latescibacteria bacterium]|nr:DNA repair exonuclease [Candidatus Latescibacterota bacterium]